MGESGFANDDKMKWFSDVRDAQRDLSDKIAGDITALLLKKECVGDVRKYLGYGSNADYDAVKMFKADDLYLEVIGRDVAYQTLESVIGYTEYLACALVRNGLKPMSLPLDSEVPYDKLVDCYCQSLPLIRDVVGRMNVQASLPLIGRLAEGQIIPDVETLSKWKEMYDWDKKEEPSDLL